MRKLPQGFTLIETLVAILILTMAIVGPLALASRELGAALIAKDQTTAFYLAQDAIETVRYFRDTTCLGTSGSCSVWLTPYTRCATAYGCTVDSVTFSAAVCPSTGCAPLKYDNSFHYFTYSSGSASIFTRTVTIKKVGSGNEYKVDVTVTWNDVSKQQHTVELQEDMYLWQ